MVNSPTKILTLEEFIQLPETKPATEYIHGQLIKKPMPQGKHSIIQGTLVSKINALAQPNKIALALPELRCTFGNRSIVPDIAIFAWNRIPVDEQGDIANVFDSYPDWIIEILSPQQSHTKVTGNILYCLTHGSHMGWLIDPKERSVLIYPPKKQPELLQLETDKLIVPDLIKEFNLTIGELFSWLKI